MMSRMRLLSQIIVSLLIAVGYSSKAWCGGPLIVNNGVVAVWSENNRLVSYNLDQGRLGNLSSSQALSLVASAFDAWSKVSTSTLRFSRSSQYLPVDVTSSNYVQTLNSLADGVNPVIYDNDGEIIDDLMGNNAKDYILGFASVYTSGNSIVMARTFLNGYFISRQKQTQNDVYNTLVHEIGHICGLDHSQYSREVAFNDITSDDDVLSVMFPYSMGMAERKSLAPDDLAAISSLYPTTYFTNSTGAISGTVKRGSKALPGVNIIARDISDPVNKIYSTVTGTYASKSGVYTLKGLPPGDYTILAEAIDSSFTSTSSVGHYAENSSGLSFQSPVQAEYYNTSDAAQEGRSVASFVTVTKLKTLSGVDINVASQTQPTDEQTMTLLAIDSYTFGGAGVSSTAPKYFLVPAGDEKTLTVKVAFSASTKYTIRVQMDTRTYTYSDTASEETIVIGSGGEIPLQNTRYIIDITNLSTSERTFTLAVSSSSADGTPTPTLVPTDTPTPTPTRTPTSTRTPTPTWTPTPTRTPTRTPTPSRTPTFTRTPTFSPTPKTTPTYTFVPTPTPTPLEGDVNRDGTIDARDLFSFLQDWQKLTDAAEFSTDLSQDNSQVIDRNDLAALIANFRRKENETIINIAQSKNIKSATSGE